MNRNPHCPLVLPALLPVVLPGSESASKQWEADRQKLEVKKMPFSETRLDFF